MREEPIPASEPAEMLIPRSINKSRKRKRYPSVISLLLLVVMMSMSVWGSYQWRQTVKIQRVFVEGNRIVPAAEIVYRTKITAGTPMYGPDLYAVRKNILSQYYIKSVEVVRELPDALWLYVEERQPIAAISHDQTTFLDEEGVALPPYRSSTMFDVPFITGFAELKEIVLGQPVSSEQILRAIALLKRAREIDPELYHLISEVHLEPDGDIVLYSSDAGVKILLGTKDEPKKLLMLKTFWNQFVHQGGADRLNLVDLRYEEQVIARWKDATKEHGTVQYH